MAKQFISQVRAPCGLRRDELAAMSLMLPGQMMGEKGSPDNQTLAIPRMS